MFLIKQAQIIVFAVIAGCMVATPALAFFSDASKTQEPVYEQSLQEQYQACTRMARERPAETFKRAKAWYLETKTLAAQHCMALSLFEMRDYPGAANELELILQRLAPEQQPDLWLSMKTQVSKSYGLSNRDDLAEKHLTEALKWANVNGKDQAMVPMLLQRGRIYAMNGEHLRAINDLDHAYSINQDPAALLERARVFIKMDKLDDALDDVRAVLKKEPLNDEASRMLGIIEKRATEAKKSHS